jgi:hypothetical protein
MFRRLFTALSALSLLLLVATVVVWVRSYSVGDVWMSSAVDVSNGRATVWQYLLMTEGGTFNLVYKRLESANPESVQGVTEGPPSKFAHFTYAFDRRTFWQQMGFSYTSSVTGNAWWTTARKTVRVPPWLPLVTFAAPPAIWFLKARRRRLATGRRAPGLCPHCGYDLRASPGHCPECGTVSAGKQT